MKIIHTFILLLLIIISSSCGYHSVTYSVDNKTSQKITEFTVRKKSGKSTFSVYNINPTNKTAHNYDTGSGFNLFKKYNIYCKLEDSSSFNIPVDCRKLTRSKDKEYSSLRFYVRDNSLSLAQNWKTPVKDRIHYKVNFTK